MKSCTLQYFIFSLADEKATAEQIANQIFGTTGQEYFVGKASPTGAEPATVYYLATWANPALKDALTAELSKGALKKVKFHRVTLADGKLQKTNGDGTKEGQSWSFEKALAERGLNIILPTGN